MFIRFYSAFGFKTFLTAAALSCVAGGSTLVPEPHPTPAIHGIYLTAWVFGGPKFDSLVRLADTSEVNSFVVDVKDDTGYLTYTSRVPLAVAIGANGQPRVSDADRRLGILRQHHIRAIARIVVARDPLLIAGRPGWSIQDSSGNPWLDSGKKPWLDAFSDSVWEYAAQVAKEAVAKGFTEVQFDYARFPDDVEPGIGSAIFPNRRGAESKREGLTRHLRFLQQRMKRLGKPFTVDVFGFTASAEVTMGIGQVWEDLVTTADVVLPMIYPSHYHDVFHGIPDPNAHPYDVVRNALMDAMIRSRTTGGRAEIRPYLQAFTQGTPPYTPAMVQQEIRAVEELGLKSWILWNAESEYPAEIFRPKSRTSPR